MFKKVASYSNPEYHVEVLADLNGYEVISIIVGYYGDGTSTAKWKP